MIAAVVKEVILLTLSTVALVPAHVFGAAFKDGLQGFALFKAQGVTVVRTLTRKLLVHFTRKLTLWYKR